MNIPYDIIFYIQTFLKWRDRVKMVSREWLSRGLRKRIRYHKWRSKKRIYSYQRTFGSQMTRMSWPHLASMLGIGRRARNRAYRLSWREAVRRHIHNNRCQSCGQYTSALVMGYHICVQCRSNDSLKYAYMVNIQTATAYGVPKHILSQIPYHKCNMSKLRFWNDIQDQMTDFESMDSNNLEV